MIAPHENHTIGDAIRNELRDKVEDAKITAIIDTGANLAEIEQALVWASGDSDIGDDAAHPLEGAVARVYEILTADRNNEEES
jgi:hypothetical protein